MTLREVAVCRGKRLFGSPLVMPHSPWSNARSHILNQVPQHRPCRGQFGYRKLLYVKLIFYHFWFFWKRNILDVKTVMRGH